MSAALLLGTLLTSLILLVYLLYKSIVVIKPYEEGIYIFMGNPKRVLKPGLNLVKPIFSRVIVVDLRPQKLEMEGINIHTSDSVEAMINAEVNYRITDSMKSVIAVKNPKTAVKELLKTHLRVIFGDIKYIDIMKDPEIIRSKLEEEMNRATKKFGVLINRIDIIDISIKGPGESTFFSYLKGKSGVVTERIDAYGVSGMVEVDGKIYHATASERIEKGEKVFVEKPIIALIVRKEGTR